jgi:hypothetical protein
VALLSLHSFQALKDYALLASLGRKAFAAGLQGFYFEVGASQATLRIYRERVGAFLTNLCAQLRLGDAVGGSGGDDSACFAAIVASDGSVGGERAQRELVAICVGVIAHSLQSVAAAELRAAPGGVASGGGVPALPASSPSASASPSAGSFVLRSFSHADPKRVSSGGAGATVSLRNGAGGVVDGRDPEEVTRELVACLTALRDLFSGSARALCLRADVVSPAVLHELVPWLGWVLSHRPAALEGALLARRQAAAINVLQALFQALQDLVQDAAALHAFVPPPSAEAATIDGSGAASPASPLAPLLSLCATFSELLSSSLYALLPVYAPPSPPEAYLSTLHRLSDPSVFLTNEAETAVTSIMNLLLTSFVALTQRVQTAVAASSSSSGASDASASAALCMCVSLLLHVMRKASPALCAHAFTVLRSLLFRSGAAVPAVLLEQLSASLTDVLLSPVAVGVDFCMEALLGSLYVLASASQQSGTDAAEPPTPTSDEQIGQAVASFTHTWRQFATHGAPRFRCMALGALLRHVLVSPDLSLPLTVQAHEARVLTVLLAQVCPVVGAAARSSDSSVEESTLALQCLLSLFHAHPSANEGLMALVLPLAVDHLSRAPEFAASILALATQQAPLFKSHVALLPLDYRTRLQRAVMSLSAEQQAAAVAQAQAQAAAVQQQQQAAAAAAVAVSSKPEGGKSTGGGGKKSKRRSDSSASSQAAPSIALSMDFAKFGSKK